MPSKKQIEDQNEVVDEQRSLFAEIKKLIGEAADELKNMENPLKGATDYFEQINENRLNLKLNKVQLYSANDPIKCLKNKRIRSRI